jgi:acyl carrier protein
MAKRALRNKARSARKTSRRPHLAPPRPRPVAADVRRDDSGQLWTLRNVEREIGAILALLAPGWTAAAIVRTTRLEDDLGFDSWGVLRVVKPVRMRLHETLSDSVVRDLKKVGDLVDYVWAKMEDVS